MAVNKVVKIDGSVIIDLSTDTVTSSAHIMAPYIGHLADGTQVTGTGQGGGTAAISVVDTEDSHGGTIRTVTALDISDTTAIASDVAQGKYFYTAQGIKTLGTASGSSTPSATSHTIYFEFSDGTNTTLTYYDNDGTFINSAITATIPTTYGNKTVTLAQLDGVTWYEVSSGIPLNTELVDYNAVRAGYLVGESGAIEAGDSWECVTDYLPIDSSMTFTFKMNDWYTFGLYDANKNVVQLYSAHDIADSTGDGVATGTLNSSRIPSTAKYVVLVGNPYSLSSNTLSLIRTA